jgi:hypothetical protein
MQQAITGFHQDEEQYWVAELLCGHSQHVRHDPPWQNRPWVITEEGRKQKLGMTLNCRKCDMPKLPKPELCQLLNQSTTLNEKSIPPELLNPDQLPDNIWAEITLVYGELQLVLDIDSKPQGFLLDPEFSGVVPPHTTFHIKPRGSCNFSLRFHEMLQEG